MRLSMSLILVFFASTSVRAEDGYQTDRFTFDVGSERVLVHESEIRSVASQYELKSKMGCNIYWTLVQLYNGIKPFSSAANAGQMLCNMHGSPEQ